MKIFCVCERCRTQEKQEKLCSTICWYYRPRKIFITFNNLHNNNKENTLNTKHVNFSSAPRRCFKNIKSKLTEKKTLYSIVSVYCLCLVCEKNPETWGAMMFAHSGITAEMHSYHIYLNLKITQMKMVVFFFTFALFHF